MSEVLYLGPRRIELGRRQLMSRRSLEPDARNLTDVLLHLQLNELSTFAAVRTVMREAFPDIRELSVRTGDDPSASSLMGEPYVYFGDRDVPVALRLCGTGLEQMLALTVGVLTATSPRLFLIDEPQAYLHPHAERSLLALLDAHDEHQYLIASHSHVLLRARPLTQVRLIHLEEGASRVVGDPEDEQLLAELGVSAADLWLSDRLLWVEGPSEEEVLSRVAQALLSQVQIASLAIRRMPEAASRFATKNAAAAEAAYQFCADTSRAVAALPVRMRFLFDADEKRPEFRQRLEEASSGMALFLRVRELENLFLDAELLHKALHNLAEGLDIDPPSAEAVAEALARYLDAHDDAQLFPGGPPDGEPPADVVKGSEVLSRLWWDFLIAQYDKVQDGGALSALALDHNPGLLQPLVDILGDMVEPIDGTRAANASVRT
jgi:hypothetical protein